jgi:hypothetical protein
MKEGRDTQMIRYIFLIVIFIIQTIHNIAALDLNLNVGDEKNSTDMDKYLEYQRKRNKETDAIAERQRKLSVVDGYVQGAINDVQDKYNNDKCISYFISVSSKTTFSIAGY